MFISLSGQLGSGKSTLCAYLQDKFGFEIFSTGAIHRKLAKEKNLSTLEFNKLIMEDKSFDVLIDEEMKKYARENAGRDVIFDSRMAWRFVPDSFKVFLLVAPKEAADRVFNNRVLEEENYASKEDALRELLDRREVENARFKEFYGVDCDDYNNYDFVVDTTESTTEKVASTILAAKDKAENGERYAKYFLSPRSLRPSSPFIANKRRLIALADRYRYGEEPEVAILKINNAFYVADAAGYEAAAAAIRAGIGLIRGRMLRSEGVTINPRAVDIEKWEKIVNHKMTKRNRQA